MKKVIATVIVIVTCLCSCKSNNNTNGQNADKKANLPDTSNTDEPAPKSNADSDDYSNWTGTYVDQFGSTLKVKGPAADGAVTFELIQADADCIGEVEGTAYLTKSSVANFYSDDETCHLSFTFNLGSIEVMETNCGNYRGMSCGTFDGMYSKK